MVQSGQDTGFQEPLEVLCCNYGQSSQTDIWRKIIDSKDVRRNIFFFRKRYYTSLSKYWAKYQCLVRWNHACICFTTKLSRDSIYESINYVTWIIIDLFCTSNHVILNIFLKLPKIIIILKLCLATINFHACFLLYPYKLCIIIMAMANHKSHFIIFPFLATFYFFFFFESSNASYINVVSFGAKPDGKFDSTMSFLMAWSSACKSKEPATIYVPHGSFLLKQVTFWGPCMNKIDFRIDGTIVAPSDYWSLGNSGYWILFRKLNRLSIHGGTLDGRGSGYWRCRRAGKSCPAGARVCCVCLCTIYTSHFV